MAETILVVTLLLGLSVWTLCTWLVVEDLQLSRSSKLTIPLVLFAIYVIIVPVVVYGRFV